MKTIFDNLIREWEEGGDTVVFYKCSRKSLLSKFSV